MPEFVVNRSIGVTADNPKQALEITEPQQGTDLSFSVNPLPQNMKTSVFAAPTPQAAPVK